VRSPDTEILVLKDEKCIDCSCVTCIQVTVYKHIFQPPDVKKIKKTTKLLLHTLGFDLKRFTPDNNPFLQLRKGIETFNIDLVLDIGANTGQFVSELRLIGYKNRVVSF
jgi:hypothetical protein